MIQTGFCTERRTKKLVFYRAFRTQATLHVKIYIRYRTRNSEKYFVPTNGFSIKWELKDGEYIRLHSIETSSKKETVIHFMVHPSLWMGSSFRKVGYTTGNIVQMCLNEVNFWWYEKNN